MYFQMQHEGWCRLGHWALLPQNVQCDMGNFRLHYSHIYCKDTVLSGPRNMNQRGTVGKKSTRCRKVGKEMLNFQKINAAKYCTPHQLPQPSQMPVCHLPSFSWKPFRGTQMLLVPCQPGARKEKLFPPMLGASVMAERGTNTSGKLSQVTSGYLSAADPEYYTG